MKGGDAVKKEYYCDETTRELLINHYRTYPRLQVEDVFKYLFQSSFGCEHLVTDQAAAIEYIKREKSNLCQHSASSTDKLDGAYSRVHLSCLDRGLSAETIGRIFCLSAKSEPNGLDALENKIRVARQIIIEGALPLSHDEFEKKLTVWSSKGYPALHHSEIFRSEYRPAYRVVSDEYVKFLSLFENLDRLLKQGPTVIAIDGGSASGKTTLASILEKIYGCTVFHVDDYFLRPEQRTEQRLSEIGGNFDRERFLDEILIPLKKKKKISYRRFNCAEQKLEEAETVPPKKLTVIEGAYSMHPELEPYYTHSVFLDITPEHQKERILKRNSPRFANRFFNEWIPLEELYFSRTNVKERCAQVFRIEDH